MTSPLADIGAELRQAREAQQRTLDELSHVTLIHLRHLQALEDGRSVDLPEPFYVKNFIRKYANALGLEGDAFANRYWDTRPLPATPPKPPQSSELMLPWWIFPVVFSALLVGALVAFAYMNMSKGSSPGGSEQAVVASAAAPVAVATAPASMAVAVEPTPLATAAPPIAVVATPSVRAATPEATTSLAAVPTPSPGPINMPPLVVPGKLVRFEVRPKEDSWMQIIADGREVQSGVVYPGQVRVWTASRSLSVRVGRPGSVVGKLGDRSLGALGPKDAPVFRRTFLTHLGLESAVPTPIAPPKRTTVAHRTPAPAPDATASSEGTASESQEQMPSPEPSGQ